MSISLIKSAKIQIANGPAWGTHSKSITSTGTLYAAGSQFVTPTPQLLNVPADIEAPAWFYFANKSETGTIYIGQTVDEYGVGGLIVVGAGEDGQVFKLATTELYVATDVEEAELEFAIFEA